MPTYMELYNAAVGDTSTRSRVMVAVAKYARFLAGGGQAGASQGRLQWATAALADARGHADQIMWAVVGDPGYLAAGEAITDAALQAALEAAVNAVYP